MQDQSIPQVLRERIEFVACPFLVLRDPVCWLWQRAKTNSGYSDWNYQGRKTCAHRIVYEMFIGPIPSGLDIDHLCRVRHCVNPAHLEPVTHRENMLRGEGFAGIRAAQTHCIHGHEFTKDNTYIRITGERQCRACKRAAHRRWKAKRQR